MKTKIPKSVDIDLYIHCERLSYNPETVYWKAYGADMSDVDGFGVMVEKVKFTYHPKPDFNMTAKEVEALRKQREAEVKRHVETMAIFAERISKLEALE